MITKEFFLTCLLSNISQVYSGKRECCRCGCMGDYISTSFHDSKYASNINDKLVERRLRRAKQLVESGVNYDSGSKYFDVQTGENRTLTFYFDAIKK